MQEILIIQPDGKNTGERSSPVAQFISAYLAFVCGASAPGPGESYAGCGMDGRHIDHFTKQLVKDIKDA